MRGKCGIRNNLFCGIYVLAVILLILELQVAIFEAIEILTQLKYQLLLELVPLIEMRNNVNELVLPIT